MPVENIGSLGFFSMANDEYLLAVAKYSRLAGLDEIGIDDLRDQKALQWTKDFPNLNFELRKVRGLEHRGSDDRA